MYSSYDIESKQSLNLHVYIVILSSRFESEIANNDINANRPLGWDSAVPCILYLLVQL